MTIMKYYLSWTTILLLLMATTTWAGSIYKWVDKEGGVHYSDRAPDKDHVEGDIETRPAVSGSPTPPVYGADSDRLCPCGKSSVSNRPTTLSQQEG
jgi:hypothetical protein